MAWVTVSGWPSSNQLISCTVNCNTESDPDKGHLKRGLLQPLHPQHKTVTLPGDNLDQRPGAVAEEVEIGAEGIRVHLALDNRHQVVDGHTRVDGLPVQLLWLQALGTGLVGHAAVKGLSSLYAIEPVLLPLGE